jgi:hypothetical protein
LEIAQGGWPLVDAFYQSCVNNKTSDASALNDLLSTIRTIDDADSLTGNTNVLPTTKRFLLPIINFIDLLIYLLLLLLMMYRCVVFVDARARACVAVGALAELELAGIDHLFGFGASADDKHPARVLAQFAQSGLTLPQSYYTAPDQTDARAALVTFASTLLGLLPGFGANAKKMASEILVYTILVLFCC